MAKSAVQTIALGRTVSVTMGMKDPKEIAAERKPGNQWACWRRLGDSAIVTSVYLKDGTLYYMLDFADECAEVAAAHCAFATVTFKTNQPIV